MNTNRVIYLQGQKEDHQVDHIEFPTGEKHIRIRGLNSSDEVVLVYNDPSGDVMKLGMSVDICRRAGVKSLKLVMPFVPYARQDEIYVDGDPLSISVFSEFVNSLNFHEVIITDPHSKVTSALIENAYIVRQHKVACLAIQYMLDYETHNLALVAPDLGAAKKVKELQQYIIDSERFVPPCILPIIQCDKTRNSVSGKINGFKILDGDPTGKHCLMVDDICDGGGTFMGLYEVLREAGASNQSLYVTHGIFSKGVNQLSSMFKNIFSSDSFPARDGVINLRIPYDQTY